MKSSERKAAIERNVLRLARVAELESGSYVATESALWECQAVRRALVEIEASLYDRLRAIRPEDRYA